MFLNVWSYLYYLYVSKNSLISITIPEKCLTKAELTKFTERIFRCEEQDIDADKCNCQRAWRRNLTSDRVLTFQGGQRPLFYQIRLDFCWVAVGWMSHEPGISSSINLRAQLLLFSAVLEPRPPRMETSSSVVAEMETSSPGDHGQATQITSIDGFFNRKRGRPPKNRFVEVYKSVSIRNL